MATNAKSAQQFIDTLNQGGSEGVSKSGGAEKKEQEDISEADLISLIKQNKRYTRKVPAAEGTRMASHQEPETKPLSASEADTRGQSEQTNQG